MGEQSWLSGELLQQAELARTGVVVVQLHLVGKTASLSARLKYLNFISLLRENSQNGIKVSEIESVDNIKFYNLTGQLDLSDITFGI